MSAKDRKPLQFEKMDALVVTAPVSAAPTPAPEQRKQVGARVLPDTYRRLKAKAAMEDAKVQDLVEQAISEFLANHPGP